MISKTGNKGTFYSGDKGTKKIGVDKVAWKALLGRVWVTKRDHQRGSYKSNLSMIRTVKLQIVNTFGVYFDHKKDIRTAWVHLLAAS